MITHALALLPELDDKHITLTAAKRGDCVRLVREKDEQISSFKGNWHHMHATGADTACEQLAAIKVSCIAKQHICGEQAAHILVFAT